MPHTQEMHTEVGAMTSLGTWMSFFSTDRTGYTTPKLYTEAIDSKIARQKALAQYCLIKANVIYTLKM